MKQYPSIPATIRRDQPYYVFDKLDGSNIRVKWTKKKGYDVFGTRTQLMDETTHIFGPAKELFLNKYGEDLERTMRKARIDRAQFYYEYWSENSFGGFHEDEPHDVTLFDVDVYRKGLLPPKEYLSLVGHLDIAKLLYHGNITNDLIESVRNGTLEGMTFEGVICKAKNPKKTPMPVMFKIKNVAWYLRLRGVCQGDDGLYEELK